MAKAKNVAFVKYRLYDVLFLGDLKLSFGRNDKGQVLRVESMSGGELPAVSTALTSPVTHKFVDTRAAAAVS